MAPDDLLERLRDLARRRDVSLATVIREALEAKVAAPNPRPRPSIIGIAASGYTDTGELSGEQRPVPRSWR